MILSAADHHRGGDSMLHQDKGYDMQGLLRATIAAFAAVLGLGLFAMTQATGANADDLVAKREDSANVVLADHDDDDDDSNDGSGSDDGDTSQNEDTSGISNDGTGSGVTGVSRDRDQSRGDLTKDRTMDGGDPTRDHTQNHTNDASRNDTR